MVTSQHPGWGVRSKVFHLFCSFTFGSDTLSDTSWKSNSQTLKHDGLERETPLSTMEIFDVHANLRGIHVFFWEWPGGGGVLSIHHCLKVLKI